MYIFRTETVCYNRKNTRESRFLLLTLARPSSRLRLSASPPPTWELSSVIGLDMISLEPSLSPSQYQPTNRSSPDVTSKKSSCLSPGPLLFFAFAKLSVWGHEQFMEKSTKGKDVRAE